MSGNITVLAKDNPEADASTKGVAAGIVGVGASNSTANVTPDVKAYIGDGSQVKAGSVNVSAIAQPETDADRPDYHIVDVDSGDNKNALTVPNHHLQTGDVIEYQTDGQAGDIGGLEQTYTDDQDETETRQYSVIYIDDDTIALGASTNDAGVNTSNETITFATAHNFLDGDQVVYQPADPAHPIPGLTAGQVYTVRVIDSKSIQLVAPGVSVTDPKASLNDFTVSNVDVENRGEADEGTIVNTIYDGNSFTSGQAVTYVAPAARTFSSVQVDAIVDFDDDKIDDANVNNIVFVKESDDHEELLPVFPGFWVGDHVSYSVSSVGGATDGQAIGGLVNGQTYRVLNIAPPPGYYSLQLAPTASGTITFAGDCVSGQDWDAHGFAPGQLINISGTIEYHRISRINGENLYIDDTFSSAGTISATIDGMTAIELTPNKSDSSVHSLVRAGNARIGGLVSGQTYYVTNPTGSSYQLAESYEDALAGNAITFDTTGLDSSAEHWVGPQSIDLCPNGEPLATGTTHDFRIDITGTYTLPPGTPSSESPHWITGEGGVNLAELVAPAGDTVSTADSRGSGGGVISVEKHSSTVNADFAVTAYVASGSLMAAGDISVLAKSETNVRASTTNATGGFVGIGRSDAETYQTSTTHAYIYTGTNISSGGDVTIDAWSNHITRGSAKAKAGGFAADVRANMTSELSYDTQAYLEDEAKIAAAGHVGITSDANVDAETHSYGDGRGFGGGGYGKTDMDIFGSQSLVTLKPDAVVIAGTTALRATTSNMDVHADGKGYGAGFVGVSEDYADININADNKVLLDSGSSLTGYNGVDIAATFNNVDTYAYSYGKVAGLFGKVNAYGNNTTTLTSTVVGETNAQVTAGPRDNASYDYYTLRSLFFTPTDLYTGDRVRMPDGTIYTYLGDTVHTSPLWLLLQQFAYRTSPLWERYVPDQTSDFLDHPTDTTIGVGPLDQLALYVDTTNYNVSIDANADVKKKALASGKPHPFTNDDQARTIEWNADVHIFAGGEAELVIDEAGNITKAAGITVNDGQTSGSIDETISVDDIGNSGGGQVYFNNAWVDGDAVGISGSGGTWDFIDSYSQVLITNYSGNDLKINDIDAVNTTDNPLVDLNSTSVTLTFDIDRAVKPTLVQILNEADSNIILNGTINNPIGSTVIHNSGGDIVAARARDQEETDTGRISLVRTAVLDIRATGNIGLGPVLDSDSPRVNVDMIYPGLPAVSFGANEVCDAGDSLYLSSNPFFTGQLVQYDGAYYRVIRSDDGATIQLVNLAGDVVNLNPTSGKLTAAQHVVGVAGDAIYLDLRAVFRDESLTEFTATVDSLTAGGSVDVLLQDSQQETNANDSTYGGVRVTALQDSASPPPPDGYYNTHFWDNDGDALQKNLAAFGGTVKPLVDSIYDFRDLNLATGVRTVAGLIAGNGNIIIEDTDGMMDDATETGPVPGLTDTTIAVRALTDLQGMGHIDVNVDNWIDLTEVTGDLRVGLIQSRGGDVTLTANDAAMVDAAGDAASDVTGVNITLQAPGGLGIFENRLDFNWSHPTEGLLRATTDGVTWYSFTSHGTFRAVLDKDTIHLCYIGAPGIVE